MEMCCDIHEAHVSSKDLFPQTAASSFIPPSGSSKVPLKRTLKSKPWMCLHMRSASLMDLLPEGSSQTMPVTVAVAAAKKKKKNQINNVTFLNRNAQLCFVRRAHMQCEQGIKPPTQRAQSKRGRMTATLAGASRLSCPQSGQRSQRR